jgi:hypothetical protein
VGALMLQLTPIATQWIASVLLILSGVQFIVIANTPKNRGGGFAKMLANLIAGFAVGFGIYMMVNLLGVRI